LTLLATGAGAARAGPPSEAKLVAYAQACDCARIDSTLAAQPFGAWLRRLVGRATAMHWEANDCGEGADGNPAGPVPVCVEAACRLRGGAELTVRLGVGDTESGISGEPEFFWAEVDDGKHVVNVDSLHELAAAVRGRRVRR